MWRIRKRFQPKLGSNKRPDRSVLSASELASYKQSTHIQIQRQRQRLRLGANLDYHNLECNGNFWNWPFAMMAAALETYAENCFSRILQLQSGTIDDVIDIHERLCKHVFETVSGLKFWFVAHWFSYWIACIIYILNIELRINTKIDSYSQYNMFRYVMLLLIVLYSFICPCVYASRVTSACRNIISRLNKTRTRDWSPDHPFYCRATLDSFIFYAERRECGFKIGQITFNSMLAWISFFLGFCGFVVKFANWNFHIIRAVNAKC